jgi:cold shock CspA family protein
MLQGRMKKLASRGFGFIELDDIDYFFHYTDYKGNWKELLCRFVANEILTASFEVDTDSTKGPKAKNVVVISGLSDV